MIFALQIIPTVAAAFVVVVTVLYFLLQGSGGEKKKKKLPLTLQDPTVKCSLPLIEKQVGCIPACTLQVQSDVHCVIQLESPQKTQQVNFM